MLPDTSDYANYSSTQRESDPLSSLPKSKPTSRPVIQQILIVTKNNSENQLQSISNFSACAQPKTIKTITPITFTSKTKSHINSTTSLPYNVSQTKAKTPILNLPRNLTISSSPNKSNHLNTNFAVTPLTNAPNKPIAPLIIKPVPVQMSTIINKSNHSNSINNNQVNDSDLDLRIRDLKNKANLNRKTIGALHMARNRLNAQNKNFEDKLNEQKNQIVRLQKKFSDILKEKYFEKSSGISCWEWDVDYEYDLEEFYEQFEYKEDSGKNNSDTYNNEDEDSSMVI